MGGGGEGKKQETEQKGFQTGHWRKRGAGGAGVGEETGGEAAGRGQIFLRSDLRTQGT